MTIMLISPTAYIRDRFACARSAMRGAVGQSPVRRPAPEKTVNEGRWATLRGEYAGPWDAPVHRSLPPITASGTTGALPCALSSPAIVHLAGRWAGHVLFEGSMDGATWSRLTLMAFASGVETTETDHPGLWRTFPNQHVRFFRLRVAHLAAGTIHASIATAPAFAQAERGLLDSAA